MQITLTVGWYDAENEWQELDVMFTGYPEDDRSSDDHQEINFANQGLPVWKKEHYSPEVNERIAAWLDEERDYVLDQFLNQLKKEHAAF